MFWLTRKRLSGSYCALIRGQPRRSCRRSVARTRSCALVHHEVHVRAARRVRVQRPPSSPRTSRGSRRRWPGRDRRRRSPRPSWRRGSPRPSRPSPTRCAAPSIGYRCIVDFQVGSRGAVLDVRLDRLVGELLDEVGAPVPLSARRVERVEQRLAAPGTASARRRRAAARPTRAHRRSASALVRGAGVAPDDARTPCCRCSSSGNGGPGGTVRNAKKPLSSSGALADELAVPRRPRPRRSSRPEHRAGVARSSTGCARNTNDVTTPKLPPPPRSAQNRSGCSLALGGHEAAVGEHDVGRRAGCRSSARTCASGSPMPPPSVRPPTPVVEMMPTGTARPNACVAWSTSPSIAPPCRRARSAPRDRRGRPSSATGRSPGRRRRCRARAPLWPPPRIATSRPCSRA